MLFKPSGLHRYMPLNHKQHYENLWKKVGNWEHESPNFKTRIPQKETLDFITFLKKQQDMKTKKHLKALDIGCGGGRHVIAFAKAGFQSEGIDISKNAITLAKELQRQKRFTKSISFKIQDLKTTKLPKERYDVVHDTGYLHHLQKKYWKHYKTQLLRTLKPKGYYKLFCFADKTEWLLGEKITKPWLRKRGHYTHFFSKQEIKEFLEPEFKVIKILEESRKLNNLRTFYIIYAQKK